MKAWISSLLILAATAFGLHWAFAHDGLTLARLFGAGGILRSIHFTAFTLLALALLSIGIYVADAIRYRVFAGAFGIKLSSATCVRASVGCLLFSWLSPGAVLGAPAAAVLLNRSGLSWKDALLIGFGKSLTGSFLLLLVSLQLVALGCLPAGVRGPSTYFLIACLLGYLVMFFLPPFRRYLAPLTQAHPVEWIKILLSQIAYFAILITVTVLLTRLVSTAHEGLGFLGRSYARSGLFTTLMYMAPTPAGSGVAELTASAFFGDLVGPSRALLLVLASRCVTYYAQILVGLVYFSCTGEIWSFRDLSKARATSTA